MTRQNLADARFFAARCRATFRSERYLRCCEYLQYRWKYHQQRQLIGQYEGYQTTVGVKSNFYHAGEKCSPRYASNLKRVATSRFPLTRSIYVVAGFYNDDDNGFTPAGLNKMVSTLLVYYKIAAWHKKRQRIHFRRAITIERIT